MRDCRCWQLEERHRPCFVCRWIAATDRRTCPRCERVVFFDFGWWRDDRGSELCLTSGRHHPLEKAS